MSDGWDRQELNALRGQLGGYQAKRGIVEYKSGMPKLTPGMQKAMLRDYAARKMTTAQIAFKYGVNQSYPTQLARRRGIEAREHWVTRQAKAIAACNRNKKS